MTLVYLPAARSTGHGMTRIVVVEAKLITFGYQFWNLCTKELHLSTSLSFTVVSPQDFEQSLFLLFPFFLGRDAFF